MTDAYTYYDDLGSYRARLGTWTATDLTTDYEVVRLPRQLDMPPPIEWVEPLEGSDLFIETEIVEALDGSAGGQGSGEFTWQLYLPTPLMVRYWRETMLDGQLSNTLTFMTFDRNYGWRVVVGTAIWDTGKSAEAIHLSWKRFPLHVVNAVAAEA